MYIIKDVLELVREGIPDEIVQKYYPDLEVEDIKACLEYAVDLIRSEEITWKWHNAYPYRYLCRRGRRLGTDSRD